MELSRISKPIFTSPYLVAAAATFSVINKYRASTHVL